jgi:cyclopropane-fatty-acyl-phospholipid synthase
VTSSTRHAPHRAVHAPHPAADTAHTAADLDAAEAADAERWPDVAVAAGSPVRAAVARALFTRAVAALPLRVRFPDGRLLGAGPPTAPVMVLHRPREFFRRFGASGLIGFGESYLAGDWDCADLTGLLTVFAAHVGDLIPPWLQSMRTLAIRRPRPATGRPVPVPAATSAVTTTCPATCSPYSSTRP